MLSLIAGFNNEDRTEKALISHLKLYKQSNGKLPGVILLGDKVSISEDFIWLLKQLGIRLKKEGE